MSDFSLDACDYHTHTHNPDDGTEIVFTVMQPALAPGETAPLILHGHGFGGARLSDRDSYSIYETLSGGVLPSTEAARRAAASGYFVISFDQRGFGASAGNVEVMSPEIEGRDISALIDWAQYAMPHRDRLAYRDQQLMLGGLGLSYGGGFQLIGACVDDRFTAIVPTAAWHDLTYSLAPDNVVKTAWGASLVALGLPTSGVTLDSRLYRALAEGLISPLTGRGLSHTISDWLYNSSPVSFFQSRLAGDGERQHCPKRAIPQVDALFIQGVGDTLFNLNEAYANACALASAGNDVHLIGMQYGHSLPFLQDIDRIAYQTDATLCFADRTVETADLQLDYLDWKLKNEAPAFEPPRCAMVLDDTHACTFDALPAGPECGPVFEFEGTAVTGGLDLLYGLMRRQSVARVMSLMGGAASNALASLKSVFDRERPPSSSDTGLIARLVNALPADHVDELTSGGTFIPLTDIERDNQAIAGLPHIEIEVGDEAHAPIAFVGIGIQRRGYGATILVNKQVRPIRGAGPRDLDLNGVSARLHRGDVLGLLVYGYHPQYLASFSAIPGRIAVHGRVALPLIELA